MKIYEAKFEIKPKGEEKFIKKLRLEFERQYTDIDTYLNLKGKETFKIKALKDSYIYYKILFANDIFEIAGKNITERTKQKILSKNPVVTKLNRTKRVYIWDRFKVKCAFDYIVQLKPRVFMEVYGQKLESVKKAQVYLKDLGLNDIVRVTYNKLNEL